MQPTRRLASFPPPVTFSVAGGRLQPPDRTLEPTGRQPFGQCRIQTARSVPPPLLRKWIDSVPLSVKWRCDQVVFSVYVIWSGPRTG